MTRKMNLYYKNKHLKPYLQLLSNIFNKNIEINDLTTLEDYDIIIENEKTVSYKQKKHKIIIENNLFSSNFIERLFHKIDEMNLKNLIFSCEYSMNLGAYKLKDRKLSDINAEYIFSDKHIYFNIFDEYAKNGFFFDHEDDNMIEIELYGDKLVDLQIE